MLVIRLTKIGKKHSPDFRLVVNEKRTPPRSGKYLELLGNYNPAQNRINLKKERIEYWVAMGAKPSVTAHNLLVKAGILKVKKLPKHKIIRKKEEAAPVAKPAEQKAESAPKEEIKPAEKPVEQKAEPEAKPKEAVSSEKPAEQTGEAEQKKEEISAAEKPTEKEAEPEEKKEEKTETVQEAKKESPKEEAEKS